MSNTDGNTRPATDNAKPTSSTNPTKLAGAGKVMGSVGVLFSVIAAGTIGYVLYSLVTGGAKTSASANTDFNVWRDVVAANFTLITMVVIGFFFASFAANLLSKAGLLKASGQVIRQEDGPHLWPLVEAANKDAITEYIRLAALSGFSGAFTRIGFTGLPLVTVALTLILLAVAVALSDSDMQKSVFDMAKLTLGAFLGSFVQRNIEQEKLAGRVSPNGTGNGGGNPKDPPAPGNGAADNAPQDGNKPGA